MKITMLGTGNALVTKCYNTCFVLEENGKYLLVDAGGGNTVLNRLISAGINWQDIHEIYVTHKHIDHILGIVWMVRRITQAMSGGKYDGEAYIYGHEEVIKLIRYMATELLTKKQSKFIDNGLYLVTVSDGETRNVFGRDMTFFDIGSTKAKQFGFTMPLNNGEKLTCCGDEPCSESGRPYALNADYLMHEAFCLAAEADEFKPYEKHHSTVKDACELAKELNVKNVILYHTEEKNLERRKELYTEEGRKVFDGGIFVPDDLEVIEI